MSAMPASEPRSSPNSTSSYLSFIELTNPPSTRSARFAKSPAAAVRSIFSSAARSGAASNPGSDRFSGGLKKDGDEFTRLGVTAHPVQEHGLADSAQPHHQQALGGQPIADAVESHSCPLDKVIATGKLRWGRAGSGGVWVRPRIHIK